VQIEIKKMLVVEKRREKHVFSNTEKVKSIEDFVEREITGARKRVDDAEAGVQQELEDMKCADIAGLTDI